MTEEHSSEMLRGEKRNLSQSSDSEEENAVKKKNSVRLRHSSVHDEFTVSKKVGNKGVEEDISTC